MTGKKISGEGAELWYLTQRKINRRTKEKEQKLPPLAFFHQGNSIL